MGSSGGSESKKGVFNENKPINIEILVTIRKAICKIIINKKGGVDYGTGFFMKISDSKRYLITNYHVINSDSLSVKIEIEIWNKKKFILNANIINIIYLKEPKDITALEIKDIDGIFEEVTFLNYDENHENGYLGYKNVDVFTIEHPYGKNALCSTGKIVKINEDKLYEFDHNIATDYGSSGSPILLLNDNINLIKIIGIHKNSDEKKRINGGTFIREIINEIKKDSEKNKNISENHFTFKNIGEKKFNDNLGIVNSCEEYMRNEKRNEKFDKDSKIDLKNNILVNNNYIIAEIYIGDNDINKKIRIINSYEEYMRNEKPYDDLDKDRMNEKEIKECIIKINDELIPFNYYYQFKKKGNNIIKYSFKNYSTKVNDIFNKCEDLIKIDLSSFNNADNSNVSLMFNGCYKLKEIKGINKLFQDKVEIKKFKSFHIINNTIPVVNINKSHSSLRKIGLKILGNIYRNKGYQIFTLINDTLIGVLEGPPNTPYENGYFLFKMLFPDDYHFKPPKFIFITNVFHPNISETGYVSVDILQKNWSPAIVNFDRIIYSIQSLLDDPNPDDFLNEKAAKLFKSDRKSYDETVRGYTFLFANHSKFLEDIKNNDIKININKENKFKFLEEKDY